MLFRVLQEPSNTVTKRVTIGDSAQYFALNIPVRFTGDMDVNFWVKHWNTYYVNAKPSSTTIVLSDTVYANGVAGPEKSIGQQQQV